MISEDDLEILLEALDTWSIEPNLRHMASLPMLIAISNDAEEAQQQFGESSSAASVETKQRKYVATVLKAKLIQIANSSIAQSVSDYLENRKNGEQD